MAECLHSAYSKFHAESVSERIFKIGKNLTKLQPKFDSLLFLEHGVYSIVFGTFEFLSYFMSVSSDPLCKLIVCISESKLCIKAKHTIFHAFVRIDKVPPKLVVGFFSPTK